MRFTGIHLLACLLLVVPVLNVGYAAQAHDGDRRHCVTRHEHRHVLNGWHYKSEIERHYDTDGRVFHRSRNYLGKQYPACDSSGFRASQVFYVRMPNDRLMAYDKEKF